MALPGKPVSEEQLDEWLNRDDKSKGYSLKEALAFLKRKHAPPSVSPQTGKGYSR